MNHPSSFIPLPFRALALLMALLVPFGTAPVSMAAVYYWDSNDGASGFGTATGTWADPNTGTTTSGWSTSAAGTDAVDTNGLTPTTSDTINFGDGATGLGAGTITVSSIVSAGDMTFASGSGAIVLSGGTIDLAAATTITVDNTSNTIDSILSGAATSLTKAGTGTLFLTNTNTYAGTTILSAGTLNANTTNALGDSSATNTLIFSGGTLQAGGTITSAATRGVTLNSTGTIDTNSQAVSIAGIISGAGGFTKIGNGTLTLTNTNTYTGTTTLSGGTLNANKSSALGNESATNTLIFSGGTLQAGGTITSGATRNVTLNSTGTIDTIGNAVSIAGIISGAGGLTKIGTGTLTLSTVASANTYIGDTTLTAGTLQGSTSSTSLTPPNPFGSTALKLDGGTLQLRANGAGGNGTTTITFGNNVTVGGNVAIDVGQQGSGVTNKTIALGTLSIGANTLTANAVTGTYALQFGTTTASGAATLNSNSGGSTAQGLKLGALTLDNSIGTGTTTTITVGGSGYTTINGAITNNSVDSTKKLALTKNDAGVLNLNGSSSFTGGMTINNGTVNLLTNQAFGGGVILNGGTLTGSVVQNFTGGLTVYGGNLGNSNWLQNIAVNIMGNSSIGSGGTGTILSASIDPAATFTLNAVTSGNSGTALTFTNGLSGSGAMRFAGGTTNAPQPKTLTLNNSSGFTGNLLMEYTANGVTSDLNFSSLGDGGKILVGGGMRNPLNVTYSGSGNTFGTRWLEFGSTLNNTGIVINSNGSGALVFNTALSVTSSAGTKTLSLGGTTVDLNNAFNGAIANGGGTAVISVAKTGASTWILGGTNSYTGGTSISNGILKFTKPTAMPATGTVAVSATGTLAVNAGAASGEFTNATSGNGSIGGLIGGVGGQGAAVTWASGTKLGIDTTNATAGTMTYSGVISGVLGLTKLGASTSLVLSGSNTFSGTTTVSAGTLAVNNSLALQNSALVTTSGTSTYAGGASLTIGGLSGASGNLGSANVLNGYTGLVTALTLNPQSGVSVSYGGNIADGFGNMTLTKSGVGTQTLTGSNSYSGGTFISGGQLNINSEANLGATSGDIQFTGTGIILLNSGSSLTYSSGRTVTVSGGANGIFGDVGINGAIVTTVNGQITGDGGVQFGHYQLGSGTADLNSTANDFQGALRIGTSDTLSQTYSSYTVNTASLADASGYGNIIFGRGNGSSGNAAAFAWSNNATSALVLDYRRIELDTTVEKSILASNSTNTARTVTVNTNLLVSRAGNKVFGLGGTNTGNNTFNGLIANSISPAAVISLEKSGGGIWSVTDASNSYTGGTTVTGGTLGFVSGALGSAGAINASGGTLLWLPGNNSDISNRLAMTAAATSTFNTNGNDVAFATGIGGGLTALLTKTGLGTLTLSGTNTYTGVTTLTGGGKLTLDYSTNDSTKLSDTANLVLDGGSLVLKGGTHAETVLSASLTNNNGTFISRESSLSTKINLNAITLTSTQSVLSFSENSIATTDRLNVAGIMGAWFTVGNRWATNAGVGGAGGSAGAGAAANGDIVGYTGGTTFTPESATSGDVNYDLEVATPTVTLTGGRPTNTLRIASLADNQTLDLGANTLTVSNLTGTNALANTSGGLLYAGGANGNYTITGTSSARLTPENGNGQALLINVYGSGSTLNLNVILSNSGSTLNKTGEGTLVMQQNNTGFTAATRVYQGALRLTTANATGTNAGGIFVQNGAALELSGGLTFVDDALTLTGDGVSSGGALKNYSGANTYQGAIIIGNGGASIKNADAVNALTVRGITTAMFADVTFGGAGNITHNTTAISGPGGVIKVNAGTTTLSVANTYTGSTTVSGGKLTVASTGTINTTSGISIGAGEFNYNSSTALTKNITFSGTGGTLSGTGAITPAVTVTSGNNLSPGNSPGTITFGTGLTLDAGSIFNWENNTINTLGSASTNWDVANITGGTLTLDNTATTGSKLRLQFTNASTDFTNAFWDSSYTWDFITGGVSGANAFDATNISIYINGVQQGSNNTIAGQGTFTTVVSGSNEQLVWTASGVTATAYWSGASSGDWGNVNNWNDAASGGSVVGALPSAGTNVHFSTTSPGGINLTTVSLGTNYTVRTLNFDSGSGAVTIGGSNILTITPTVAGTGILVDTANATLNTNVALGNSQTWTVNTSLTLTVNGVVSETGGSRSLTKLGLGDLVLGGSNTYTGVTQVSQGKVKINNLNNLGAGGVGNSVGLDGGTLVSTGNSYALGPNRSILLGAGPNTVQVDGSSDNLTVDGIISGTGSLTKSGAGVLTLSATNTYTGNTNLNAGTINLGAAENAGVSGPLGNQAADAAGTIVMGGGTLQYSGSNNFDYSGRFSTAGSQVWNIDTGGQNVAFATALVGASSTLTKLGTGTLSLNGTNSNTYNGITTVSGGTLELNKTGGATAIAGNLTINGGTVKLLQNEQIANTATITQTSGAFNLGGKTETIVSYNKTGGTFTTGRGGSLIGTGSSITYDGAGTNAIEVESSIVDGHVTLTNGATVDVYGANAPFDGGSPGATGGILQVNSGGTGLDLNGSGGNIINLRSDDSSAEAGSLVLNGNLTTSGTGLNTIANVDVALHTTVKGHVDVGSGVTFTVADTVSGNGTDLAISAVITGTSGLTKAGAGTMTLTAVNTYTGATAVDAGIFQVGVAGVGSTASGSAVTATNTGFSTATTTSGVNANNVAVTGQKVVTDAPVIAGTGSILGNLTIGASSSSVGVIKPGDLSGSSNGTLNIGGNLVVNNGSQLQLGLTSTTQNDAAFNWYAPSGGSTALDYLTTGGVTNVSLSNYDTYWKDAPAIAGGYDSINVTGTLSLGTGGTDYPTVLVSVNGSYTPVLGDIFKLLDWSGISHGTAGTIGGTRSFPSDLVLPDLGAGYSWDTSAFSSFGVVVVIPEPGRVMLLFFGLAALFLRRRR